MGISITMGFFREGHKPFTKKQDSRIRHSSLAKRLEHLRNHDNEFVFNVNGEPLVTVVFGPCFTKFCISTLPRA